MDGQTFFEKVLVFPPDQESIYMYLDYFSNFTPILTKVSIPFFPMEMGMKIHKINLNFEFFAFDIKMF